MKKTIRNIMVFTIVIVTMLAMVGCKVTTTLSVNFGFKSVDTASEYNESLTAFEVGKRFYTSIKIKINTDKKDPRDYKVVVTIPKTKDVEMEKMGGLNPISNNWDSEN